MEILLTALATSKNLFRKINFVGMSESSYFSNDSDDEEAKQEDCALVDAISEINFDENRVETIGTSGSSDGIISEQSSASLNFVEEEHDYMNDTEWIGQKCHVFILSTAGKPVYSLNGSEEKLATSFGLLQALVSVVQSNDDAIRSITASNIKFVFLVKSPLILVGVSKLKRSEHQILNQLMYVYTIS